MLKNIHKETQSDTFYRQRESSSYNDEAFRLLIESVEDYAIFMIDINGIITSWNKGAEHLKGYTEKEILGKHFSLFYTPEEIKKKEPQNNLNETINKGLYKTEGWRLRKDGSLFWANVIFKCLYNETGELIGFAKVTHDISERKRFEEIKQQQEEFKKLNEENLKRSLKEISDYKYALDESAIVAITDQKGIIKHVNNNFCKISKYSAEELIGQDHRIINSGYHSKEFIRNLWVTIANGKIWRGELKTEQKTVPIIGLIQP